MVTCPACNHEHQGARLGYICIGCPCPRTPGKPGASVPSHLHGCHPGACVAGCPAEAAEAIDADLGPMQREAPVLPAPEPADDRPWMKKLRLRDAAIAVSCVWMWEYRTLAGLAPTRAAAVNTKMEALLDAITAETDEAVAAAGADAGLDVALLRGALVGLVHACGTVAFPSERFEKALGGARLALRACSEAAPASRSADTQERVHPGELARLRRVDEAAKALAAGLSTAEWERLTAPTGRLALALIDAVNEGRR